jgi:hypothetical protein
LFSELRTDASSSTTEMTEGVDKDAPPGKRLPKHVALDQKESAAGRKVQSHLGLYANDTRFECRLDDGRHVRLRHRQARARRTDAPYSGGCKPGELIH